MTPPSPKAARVRPTPRPWLRIGALCALGAVLAAHGASWADGDTLSEVIGPLESEGEGQEGPSGDEPAKGGAPSEEWEARTAPEHEAGEPAERDAEDEDGRSAEADEDGATDEEDAQREAAGEPLVGASCEGEGPCRVDATGLPVRVLPRSFSPLFDAVGADAEAISNAVSAFKPLYVFGVQGLDTSDVTDIGGWYQVGFSERGPMGWMRAKDVVEWRQALLLEYTHPGTGAERRSPVLMFETREAAQETVLDNARAERTKALIAAIGRGERPDGVIGKEPSAFLNIDEDFYLLPILEWEREPALDLPSHYLKVFAAVPGARAESVGEGTLEDESFLAEDTARRREIGLVDIVFVIDMTGSMQPYIDSVKRAVEGVIEQIESEGRDLERVRFGLIGYRDSVAATPELEWTVKNLTGETLVDAEAFGEALGRAEAARVSSDEWAEDVHGGFLAGINAPWRSDEQDERSLRIMLLIGDASGHDSSDPARGAKNSTGMTAADLNTQARGLGIYPYTIYLQDERAEPDWERAQAQFAAFGGEGQGDEAATFSTPTEGAEENLRSTASFIAREIAHAIENGEYGRSYAAGETGASAADDEAVDESGRMMIDIARGVMQAALVDYFGDEATPPRDFQSWVHDYDLADPNREALAVRVLATRRQLDNITRQTEALLDAVRAQNIGNIDFLVALKQGAVETSLGQSIETDRTLGEQEFLPRWIASLPYRSRVLALTPTEFANFSSSEQDEFQSRLESKLRTYKELLGTDRWVQLDPADDPLEEVIPLPLTLLP